MAEQGLKFVFFFIILIFTAIGGTLQKRLSATTIKDFFSILSNSFSLMIFFTIFFSVFLQKEAQETNQKADQMFKLKFLFVLLGIFACILFEIGFYTIALKILWKNNQSDEQTELNQQSQSKRKIEQAGDSDESDNQLDILLLESNKYIYQFKLALALIVHSFIEGLAIGVSDYKSYILNLGVSTAIHKLPATIAIAIALTEQPKEKFTLIMGSFVISTPLGILIGEWLQKIEEPLVIGFFFAICAFSLIYCAFSLILQNEFIKSNRYLIKYLFFILSIILLVYKIWLNFGRQVHNDHEGKGIHSGL